ncbi:HET-domain-containing protein [Pseudovirgaria hyperparasitica]|uniref:HET-domain-containing protein n=1 Tax=Pseudovirgaria hyperparasitica TaxID=470096 RepID=A0A6A6WEW5_9PEZI|nr:HET-domain-containing protein [Pseudovirgaria hyperparasitica]KAF2760530.1 HET-domain-containing protein [Pseudovirgaria hyperparasitica]
MSTSSTSSTSFDNPSTWSKARDWLETCVKNHTDCTKSDVGSFLPRRLIDVGSADCVLRPRLCLSENLPATTSYLTLSHCWGSEVPGILSTGLLPLYLTSILTDTIPEKFVQAMECTRKLGYRYIWIDCLCILQDSPDDWAEQSAEMDKVYENSVCNIAANNSDSWRTPLFLGRDPSVGNLTVLALPGRVVPDNMEYFVCLPRMWRRNFSDSPLFQRAWVVQELALSPRSLHFCTGQMWWDCKTHTVCESESWYGLRRVDDIWQSLSPRLKLSESSNKSRVWERIVCRYTAAQLTYECKDKLVALSALARRMGEATDYLAGLWKWDLPRALLWHIESHDQTPLASGAPSWSWASVKGRMPPSLHRRPYKYNAKVLSASTDKTSEDPFGTVSGGEIVLEGLFVHESRPDELCRRGQHQTVSWEPLSDEYQFVIGGSTNHGPWGLILRPTGDKGQFTRVGVYYRTLVHPPARTGGWNRNDYDKQFNEYAARCHAFVQTCDPNLYLRKSDRYPGYVVISIV